jgi:hypothetical protein
VLLTFKFYNYDRRSKKKRMWDIYHNAQLGSQINEKEIAKQCATKVVNNSKADEREQAYQKHFRDDPQFRGRSYRLRDNYIWHKDEAYECIDYYLKTGIEP